MSSQKTVKYGRVEMIKIETGAQLQVWAVYEGTEPNVFEGKSPIAWFTDHGEAKKLGSLRDMAAVFKQHLSEFSSLLKCDPNVEQVGKAIRQLDADLSKSKAENAALRRQWTEIQEQGKKLRASIEEFFQRSSIEVPKP